MAELEGHVQTEEEIEAMMRQEEEEVNKLRAARELEEKREQEEKKREEEEAKAKKKGGKKPKKNDIEMGKEKDPKALPTKKVGFFELFKFADCLDIFLLLIGVLCAIGHGILMPFFALFFGDILDSFGNPGDSLTDLIIPIVYKFLILAAAAFVSSFIQVAALMLSGQRQSNRMRQAFLRAALSQEMGWYDVTETGALTTHISGDILLIQDAISEKIGTFFQMTVLFVAGFVMAFVRGWQLSLVILSVVPLLMICGGIVGKLLSEATTRGQTAYAHAGAIAEEVISSMRTVTAFGGEEIEKNRYYRALLDSLATGIKKGHLAGAGLGVTMLVMFGSYALAFWYGNELINQGVMSAGKIVTVFFSIIIGSMSMGQASPAITAFGTGLGAASKIFEVIERKSKIDPLSDQGIRPQTARGEVEFKDVKFTYPSRPDQPILKGISFSLQPGKTLAFVGSSGCGKSTSIALLERFYDPSEGTILFDGHDVKTLSLKWLREHIGIVSQEPILFDRTISQNIAFGREGSTQEDIERCAKMANAHDFIMKLPKKYETMVGERGTQLSGGQKQRIAIARALIRDPKILLLDEATSALDNNSEKIVQDALDKARMGRSTIVIAHRLSTIRNADMICVMEKGLIIERGTHEELMAKTERSLYQDLVKLQEIAGKEDEAAAQVDVDAIPDNKIQERSLSSDHKQVEETDDDEAGPKIDPVKLKGVFTRVLKLNAPETGFILLGSLAAITNGAVFPVFSLIFSEVLSDLLLPDQETRTNKIVFWCGMFVVLAVATGLANYLQNAMNSIAGERLIFRLRNMLFGAILRQDIGWFDDEQNATGVLSTKLASDATVAKGMIGERIALLIQSVATLAIGLGIAFAGCWKLALVTLAALPFVGAGGAMQLKIMTGFNKKSKKAYENSGKIATEAIQNIRTVTGLGIHDKFFEAFRESLLIPDKAAKKSAVVAGLGFAYGEAMQFLIWAVAFYYGSYLVQNGECDFNGMMKALSAIIFAAAMLGQVTALLPDLSKAKAAAAGIFEIVDRVPPIDSSSEQGIKLDHVKGEIEFKNVRFFYPTRPAAKILKGLSFTIKPGTTLALVGPSGCGKSTTVGLLERFYTPEHGQILLDGVDISTLNIQWLRQQIGIVSQEPILFGTSIKENIAFGKPAHLDPKELDLNHPVKAQKLSNPLANLASDDEIQKASIKANAHKFISALKGGYDTDVGDKGSQLSGGQKQRVAIARALIRDPKILLLDEATSALDSESEKIVQHALGKASAGRTTIVIAHRLSTIQNADQIAVVDNGVVAEIGTHFELLAKKGLYYDLVHHNSGSRT